MKIHVHDPQCEDCRELNIACAEESGELIAQKQFLRRIKTALGVKTVGEALERIERLTKNVSN